MIKPTKVFAEVVLLTPSGETVLLKRTETDKKRPLQWDIAGGAVDENEDFLAGAVREVKEETGLSINPQNTKLAFTITQNFDDSGNVCWLFFTHQLSEKVEITLSAEHQEALWLPISEAVDAIEYDCQKQALEYIQKYVLG